MLVTFIKVFSTIEIATLLTFPHIAALCNDNKKYIWYQIPFTISFVLREDKCYPN